MPIHLQYTVFFPRWISISYNSHVRNIKCRKYHGGREVKMKTFEQTTTIINENFTIINYSYPCLELHKQNSELKPAFWRGKKKNLKMKKGKNLILFSSASSCNLKTILINFPSIKTYRLLEALGADDSATHRDAGSVPKYGQ